MVQFYLCLVGGLSVAVGPHLFPLPRNAGEDQGRGLNNLNDWNVWNGKAEDIDRGDIFNFAN